MDANANRIDYALFAIWEDFDVVLVSPIICKAFAWGEEKTRVREGSKPDVIPARVGEFCNNTTATWPTFKHATRIPHSKLPRADLHEYQMENNSFQGYERSQKIHTRLRACSIPYTFTCLPTSKIYIFFTPLNKRRGRGTFRLKNY